MANSTCTVSIDMSFTEAGGASVSAPRKTITTLYQSYEEGSVAIPAGATGSTEYALPFGGITTKATMLRIDNVSGAAPVTVHLNGATGASHTIGVGGTELVADPVGATGATGATYITSAKVVLTEAQVTAGKVDYWAFGDPA